MERALKQSIETKRLRTLKTVAGKSQLREEIVWRLNKLLTSPGIRQVYFQEFYIAEAS